MLAFAKFEASRGRRTEYREVVQCRARWGGSGSSTNRPRPRAFRCWSFPTPAPARRPTANSRRYSARSSAVIVFQYPGRQDRAAEPALASLQEIAAGAFAEFAASDHDRAVPVVTFGHSMGALVAFEFVRLAEAGGIDVRHLHASAAVAPSNAAEKPSHPKDDEEILNHLAALEGTDSDVIANRELMRLALPVIKADYNAFDAYSCAEDIKVATPIHAIGGDQDPYITLRRPVRVG